MKRNAILRRTLLALCGLFLTAALLAGCAFSGSSDDSRGFPFSFLPQSETETEEPEPEDTAPEKEILEFYPFEEDAPYVTICEGPSGTILIVLERFGADESAVEPPDGDISGEDGPEEDISGEDGNGEEEISDEDLPRTVMIYDPRLGKCIRSFEIPITATVSDHLYDDDTFAVVDNGKGDSAKITFYNAAGKETDSFVFREASVCFVSSDKRSVYFAAQELMRADLATGEIEKIPLPGYMQVSYIRAMLPDSDRLLLTLPKEPYGIDTCTGLFDPDTGKFVLLQNEYLSWTGRTDRSVVTGPDPDGGDAYMFWNGTSCRKLSDPPPRVTYGEGSLDGRFCLFEQDEADDLLYSPSDNTYVVFPDAERLVSGILYLEDCDAFFRVVRNDAGRLVPTLIRRGFLPFTERIVPLNETVDPIVDQAILEHFEEANAAATLAAELSACRDRANVLEERYHIQILLSDECALRSQNAGFVVHPSSEWSQTAEIESVNGSLDVMESLFDQYPSEFFEHFHKGPDNGLVFMLTGAIESTYNVIAYERFEYISRNYEIVVDMSYLYDLKCTLIHELWHAIEDSTNSEFPYDEWNAIVPPGFSYQDAYENGTPPEGWTLFGNDPEDIYFVDDYSKTYAKEDRARIIEYFFGREELRGDLLNAPHLVEKYRILIEHIRRVMGTEDWPERMPWEVLP